MIFLLHLEPSVTVLHVVILGCQHGDVLYSFFSFLFSFFLTRVTNSTVFFSAPWIVTLFFKLNFPAQFHIFGRFF